MKKIFMVLVSVLVVLLILSFAKDAIIKVSAEKGVELVTGLPLKIQSFKLGIINQLVGIKNLKLYNPKGYKDRIMLDMPEIYVDYDLPAIFKGKVHLQEMRINMKEFVVVKNEKGELNLDSLKVVQAQKEKKRPEAKEKGKVPEIQIDALELKVGKVIYKDYSRGVVPSVKEFHVNLKERYTNITDPYKLVSLIVVKAMMNTTIASLTNFDLKGLQGTVSDTLATAGKVAQEVAVKAQETITKTTETAQKAVGALKETGEGTQEVIKDTAETLKKTTEGLAGAFKSPFGAKEE
ncbi:MAG: hypothetical protein ABID09_04980 [Candidatus Omnitrophota bacterium]